MREHYGQLEQAFRDTCVHLAERGALAHLGKLYGFETPGDETTERAYGAGLHQAAYARRGTRDSMATIIEAMFSDYNVAHDTGFVHRTAYPHELIETANPAALVLDEDTWAGRYVRTAAGRHLVIGVELNATRAPYGTPVQVLKLAPVSTNYTVPYSRTTAYAAAHVPLYKLPFVLRETNPGPLFDGDGMIVRWTPGLHCTLEILLFADVVASTPPTYLLDDGGTTTPGGMPYGGHLLEDSTYDGNQDDGPYPIYLIDGRAFSQVEGQLQRLMIAGTWCEVRREPLR